MRCLTLAQTMHCQGWRISIAVDEAATPTLSRTRQFDYSVVQLPPGQGQSAETLIDRICDPCQIVVVDDYDLDATFEAALSGWAEDILAIDDLADRVHHCTFLLDPSPRRSAASYSSLVPSDCRVMTGPAFALIRQEITQCRARTLQHRMTIQSIRRVLISFGMTDLTNMTMTALDAIRSSGLKLFVDVVLGNEAPHLNEVHRAAISMGDYVKIHTNPTNFPELMCEADIAIGAPGTSSLERCCLGLPTITIPVADNQNHNAHALACIGAIMLLGANTTPSALAATLHQMTGNIEIVKRMSAAAFGVCDGRGSARTFLSICPEITKGTMALSCRPATISDIDTIFRWQCAPGSRSYSRNSNCPTYAEHNAWMLERLASKAGLFEMMLIDGNPAGMARLDADESMPNTYEVSILISPNFRGIGVGTAALHAIRRLVPEGIFLAYIHQDNLPSHKIFSAAGYVHEADHLVSMPRP